MKTLIITSLFIFLSSSIQAQAFELIETKTGNYCKDQTLDWFHTKFGSEATIGKLHKFKKYKSNGFMYFTDTSSVCSGTIYIDLPVASSCEMAHYWYVPKFLHTVWADGDCKKIFPKRTLITEDDFSGCYHQDCQD